MREIRLSQLYKDAIRGKLKDEFSYQNPHQIPKLLKVTINMGVGKGAQDKKFIDKAMSDLVLIAAQKPKITYVKNSEAGFKIREGWPIGLMVTLRGEQMYDFLERLLHISLPLSRDFRGLNKKSFDRRGNYNFGIRDQSIFREIPYEQVDAMRGMDIAVTTTAKTDEEAYALLVALGFPFTGANVAEDQE